MKALTLHQPWASLIAIGAKRIETRSWSTSYRGPLAIHAAAHVPAGGLGYVPGRVNAVEILRAGGVLGGADMDHRRPASWMECKYRLPLGAVVATCRLVDVVPTDLNAPSEHHDRWGYYVRHDGVLFLGTQEFAFGDFTRGRYAWLLADVKPLDPSVPAKGRQGLWDIDLEAAA